MIETEITIPNECSPDKVSPDHKPILRSAIESYRRNLDRLLASVRLLGSAARGESTFGTSDIDFVGLVSMNPEAHQREMLESEARKLTLAHQCVARVDFEIEIKGRVQPPRAFILRTDSICIWGADDYSAAETRISNTALAELVTPDLQKLVAGYRQRLKGALSAEDLGSLGRSAGKDLLKCLRKYLILDRGVYRKSAADIHTQLTMYFPQHREAFDCLLRIHDQPVERREELAQILKLAETAYGFLARASA